MEGSEDAYVGYMTIKVSTESEPEVLAVYKRSLPSSPITGLRCRTM